MVFVVEVPELEEPLDPGQVPAQLLQSLPSASPFAPAAPGWTSGTGCLWGEHGRLSRQDLGGASNITCTHGLGDEEWDDRVFSSPIQHPPYPLIYTELTRKAQLLN